MINNIKYILIYYMRIIYMYYPRLHSQKWSTMEINDIKKIQVPLTNRKKRLSSRALTRFLR